MVPVLQLLAVVGKSASVLQVVVQAVSVLQLSAVVGQAISVIQVWSLQAMGGWLRVLFRLSTYSIDFHRFALIFTWFLCIFIHLIDYHTFFTDFHAFRGMGA